MTITVEGLKQARQQVKEAEEAVLKAQAAKDKINKELAEAEAQANLEAELKKIAERQTLADRLKAEQERINNLPPEDKLKIAKRIENLQQLQLTNELIRNADKHLKGLENEKNNVADKIENADKHLKALIAEQLQLNNDIKNNS
jgi:DNA repair exonuclease SbcCD ATPase subunit